MTVHICNFIEKGHSNVPQHLKETFSRILNVFGADFIEETNDEDSIMEVCDYEVGYKIFVRD